jgi:hypothetical protein
LKGIASLYKLVNLKYCVQEQADHVDGETDKKEDEPLVVAVAETVIYEHTVVVKFLNTSVAEVAVVCVFGPQGFAGYAHIVKVVVFRNKLFEETQEIGLPGHVARVNQSQNVEQHRSKEKERCHN